MQTNSCIITSDKLKVLTKNINSQISHKHQKEFIKTLAGDNNYNITSNTKSLLFYNPHINQYEIILFECSEKDFLLEYEVFQNAYDLFDIPKHGYRVFIYQNKIYIYHNGDVKFFKLFQNDFTIDEISDYIVRNYGITDFEFTYIKQNQFDDLLNTKINKQSLEYITFENNYEIKILLAFVATITLCIAYILFLILNQPKQTVQPLDMVVIDTQNDEIIEEEYFVSQYLNELFLNLNSQQIILLSINLEQNILKAVLKSENKDKLYEFASKYSDNLAIKKIIYDNLTNYHIMEIEFAIKDKGIL